MHTMPIVTVGGLIIAPDGEILLVRSEKWSHLFSLPGGKVEWGETREQAFRREILEETGLEVSHVSFAFVQESIFSAEFWEKKHFVMNDFIAQLHPKHTKNDVVLNEEAYEYLWIAPKKALQLVLHRECRLLIEWYIRHHLEKIRLGMIGFQNECIKCIIGELPEERIQEQEIYISVKVKIDFTTCFETDDVNDTIDYVKMVDKCRQIAQERKFHLLEALSCAILDELFKTFNIEWAWVQIKKPNGVPTADFALVEMEQTKELLNGKHQWVGH